jgi:hopanoid biosynthesis associated protein HpnK
LEAIAYEGVILRDFSPEGSGVDRYYRRGEGRICFTPDPFARSGQALHGLKAVQDDPFAEKDDRRNSVLAWFHAPRSLTSPILSLLDWAVRRLIINADDFGLTSGVNRAIVDGHERGVVTSATLMANGRAFDEAVALARSRPRLGVGCHIVLVDGAPMLDTTKVRSLLDPGSKNAGDSRFREGISKFAALALLGRLDTNEIEAEATAQIRKLQSSGIAVTHLDSHKHTHMFPQVLKPVLRAARACGVRAVRNPFERIHGSQVAARPSLWRRWTEVGLLRSLARQFRDAVRQAGMITPDGTIAIVATGALDERLLRKMVENLPDGTWELVCHPGYNDADLRGVRTRLRESREQELRILTSPATHELLAANQVEVVSYRDLAPVFPLGNEVTRNDRDGDSLKAGSHDPS